MEKKSNIYSLILFSLVFLFIPSFNVIDLMPDFLAWFILAKVFERAADSAPYFEEARSGFIKLGYVNLAKILGFIIIILVKSRDTVPRVLANLSNYGAVDGFPVALYINGQFLGYSQVTHNSSEFDATPLLRQGYDIILVARTRTATAKWKELNDTFLKCCRKPDLLEEKR